MEGKGGLGGGGEAYKEGELVVRDTEGRIREVVLSCSDDADIVGNCCAVFGRYRLHNFLLYESPLNIRQNSLCVSILRMSRFHPFKVCIYTIHWRGVRHRYLFQEECCYQIDHSEDQDRHEAVLERASQRQLVRHAGRQMLD